METAPQAKIMRILAPIDFSEYSERALTYAAAFAEHHDAQLIVFHVIHSLPARSRSGAQSEWTDRFEVEAKKQAGQQLAALIAKICRDTVDVMCEVAVGNPTDEIVECARSRPVDLIIMPTHGRTGLKHALIGSVAEATVRHAPCPVLTLRHTDAPGSTGWETKGGLSIDTVLVGIDFSPTSHEALNFAKELTDRTGSTLVLTHVSPVHYPIGEFGGLDTPQLDAELLESADRRLRQLAEHEAGKNLLVKHEVRQGNAGAEIVDVAKQYHADLIVVGTRGLTGLKHALLGSTAEYLMRHGECPVLIVRPQRVQPDEEAKDAGTERGVEKDIIRAHPFLRALASDEIDIIIKDAHVVEFEPGEIIFRQGDYASSFYLIQEGRVSLEVHTPERDIDVEVLQSGEVLGWSWLFPPFAWHFQARALDHTVALQLNAARILIEAESDDTLGHHLTKCIAQVLIQRLQLTQKRLAEECHGAEVGLGNMV